MARRNRPVMRAPNGRQGVELREGYELLGGAGLQVGHRAARRLSRGQEGVKHPGVRRVAKRQLVMRGYNAATMMSSSRRGTEWARGRLVAIGRRAARTALSGQEGPVHTSQEDAESPSRFLG